MNRLGVPYYGGKKSHLEWLLPLLDVGESVYVEPFGGGMSVALSRRPVTIEHINDGDNRIINLWMRIQEDPEGVIAECDKILFHPYYGTMQRKAFREKKPPEEGGVVPEGGEFTPNEEAALAIFSLYCSFSGTFAGPYRSTTIRNFAQVFNRTRDLIPKFHKRLKHMQFTCMNVLEYLDWHIETNNDRRILMYCDPPYLNADAYYDCKMDEQTHADFCKRLVTLAAKGNWSIAVSNYQNEIYDDILVGWHKKVFSVNSASAPGANQEREEVLWLNYDQNKGGLL